MAKEALFSGYSWEFVRVQAASGRLACSAYFFGFAIYLTTCPLA